MSASAVPFALLRREQFDTVFTFHAESILGDAFADIARELEATLLQLRIPVRELIAGGGGEAPGTQRLRRSLAAAGWQKTTFQVEKRINERTTFSQTHEVDHVRKTPDGALALEIEWNNKDPFFDRDLENFSRLHADGAISVGMIVTRGQTLQRGLESRIRQFAERHGIRSFADLAPFAKRPTDRQQENVERMVAEGGGTFADVWAAQFVRDKFGSATTHWSKLQVRIDRGVGSPCPIVGIGIPLECVVDDDASAP